MRWGEDLNLQIVEILSGQLLLGQLVENWALWQGKLTIYSIHTRKIPIFDLAQMQFIGLFHPDEQLFTQTAFYPVT